MKIIVLLVFVLALRVNAQLLFEEHDNAANQYVGSLTKTGSIKLYVGANIPTGTVYFANNTWGAFIWAPNHVHGVADSTTLSLSPTGTTSYTVHVICSLDYGTTTTTVGSWSYSYVRVQPYSGSGGGVSQDLGVFAQFNAQGSVVPNKLHLHIPVTSNGNAGHSVAFNHLDSTGAVVESLGTATAVSGTKLSTAVDVTKDWQLGDKVQVVLDGKVVDAYDPTVGNSFPVEQTGSTTSASNFGISFDDEKQTATTAPASTTAQTNGGSTTTEEVMPDGSKRINTVLNNGGTTISGTTGGATTQDIYNAVKAAVTDSANASSGAAPTTSMDAGGAIEGTTGTQVADAQTKWNGVKVKVAALSSGAGGSLGATSTALNLPTSVGKTWSYAFTLPVVGAQALNWSGYSTQINSFRLLCLVCITFVMWFACIRAVRAALN